MLYLRVENRVASTPSVEYLSTLGLSSSREDEDLIGQFGTGFPFSLALFAREGLLERCKLCLGLDVYTYKVEGKAVKDASGRNTLKELLYMKKQNGGKTSLNISKEFGELDWTDLGMALREIISNGLDGAKQYDGSYASFKFELVDESECRAKDGTIRFYLPVTQSVQNWLMTVPENFICMGSKYDENQTILPNPDRKVGKVFRKGVKVGITGNSWNEYPSLFNYNINNIRLNESRVVDPDHAIADCARHLAAKATLDQAKLYVREVMVNGREDLYESKFDSYYFDIMQRYENYGNKEVWTKAINEVIGNAVIVADDTQKELVESRGHKSIMLRGNMKKEDLKEAGLKEVSDILNFHDLQGREIVPTNENVRNTFDKICQEIERMSMHSNKQRPEIKEYVQNTLAKGSSEGYYYDNTVFVRKDYEDDAGFHLIEVLIHELAHHYSGATDCNRDFEGWAFRIAANLMKEKFDKNG